MVLKKFCSRLLKILLKATIKSSKKEKECCNEEPAGLGSGLGALIEQGCLESLAEGISVLQRKSPSVKCISRVALLCHMGKCWWAGCELSFYSIMFHRMWVFKNSLELMQLFVQLLYWEVSNVLLCDLRLVIDALKKLVFESCSDRSLISNYNKIVLFALASAMQCLEIHALAFKALL